MSGFTKAVRSQVKLRVALIGPSGSGKTYSALRLAKGIGGKVALIDTEGDRGTYYADEFDYDRMQLDPPFTPERYIAAIREAEQAGYSVLIMDSASHEWIGKGGILEIHGNMPGNSYANWNSVTPRHDAWVDAQVRCKCHLIVTLRGKDEYVLAENDKGKQVPQKVGIGPVQRGGLEYEYTTAFLLDMKHVAATTKDNTHIFDGSYEVLTEAHGEKLRAWSESGAPAAPKDEKQDAPTEAPEETPREKALREQLRAKLEECSDAGLITQAAAKSALEKEPEKDAEWVERQLQRLIDKESAARQEAAVGGVHHGSVFEDDDPDATPQSGEEQS